MPSALFETLLLNPSRTTLTSQRFKIPAFLYGCAWKKDRTADLVYQALKAGFTGIDVAAQPKHYDEKSAGEGMRRALKDETIRREDLFVQTKFTSLRGQDPQRIPYNPNASVTEQVHSSVASSLRNLRHTENEVDADADSSASYIDCLVLHSPLPTLDQTVEAWTALESYVPNRIRNLGISNTPLSVLKTLYEDMTVKPSVVQNRFHAETGYEVELRAFCRERGIVFQSFWTLTANPRLLRSRPVVELARAVHADAAVALYAFVMGLEDTIVLNGTTSHMVSDLDGLEAVRAWVVKHEEHWVGLLAEFKGLVGDQ